MKRLLIVTAALILSCNPTTGGPTVEPDPSTKVHPKTADNGQMGDFGKHVTGVDQIIFGYPTTATATSMIDDATRIETVISAIGMGSMKTANWPKCMPKSSVRFMKGGQTVGEFGYCGGVIREGELAFNVKDADALDAEIAKAKEE